MSPRYMWSCDCGSVCREWMNDLAKTIKLAQRHANKCGKEVIISREGSQYINSYVISRLGPFFYKKDINGQNK